MYKVGDKIKFAEEKQRYTIRACNERYLVCTKPMNALKTYLYTIVDLEEKIRGTDGFVFCLPWGTDEEAMESFKLFLEDGQGVGHRNRIPLNIVH